MNDTMAKAAHASGAPAPARGSACQEFSYQTKFVPRPSRHLSSPSKATSSSV